jgi:hypothetical protein
VFGRIQVICNEREGTCVLARKRLRRQLLRLPMVPGIGQRETKLVCTRLTCNPHIYPLVQACMHILGRQSARASPQRLAPSRRRSNVSQNSKQEALLFYPDETLRSHAMRCDDVLPVVGRNDGQSMPRARWFASSTCERAVRPSSGQMTP